MEIHDIFTTSDEKSRENDGTYIRFHDIFTTFSRLVPVVFHDRFTTVSRHFHHAIFTTSWKMNLFSRHFHQGDKGIFTRVSRHIS